MTSGASVSDARWIETELFRLKTTKARACLEDQGRGDLTPNLDGELNDRLSNRYYYFPDEAELLANGFDAPVTSQSAEALTASDAQILSSCLDQAGDGEATRAEQIVRNTHGAWQAIVEKEYADASLDSPKQEFTACLTDKGVPADEARNEDTFFVFVDEQRQANEASDPSGKAAAEIYVECGSPLFAARESLLNAVQPEFITTHSDDLQQLQALLVQ